MTALDELEKLAKAATPGPWIVTPSDDVMQDGGKHLLFATSGKSGYFNDNHAADYLPAAPQQQENPK